MGTGSGAIALSLATEGPFARVVATDVSAGALEVARANHAAAAPGAPVEFRSGAGVRAGAGGDLRRGGLQPAVHRRRSERDALDAGVRDWEPAQALFAGETGLDVIRELVAGAPGVLRAGGLLALEIGWRQADAVAELVRAVDGFSGPVVRRDLEGRDRIVTAIFGTRE